MATLCVLALVLASFKVLSGCEDGKGRKWLRSGSSSVHHTKAELKKLQERANCNESA